MEKRVDTTINDLPDELLLHILSFLPTKVVFRTSFLSKRWKRLCDTIPQIDLRKIFIKEPSLYSDILIFFDKYLFMREENKLSIQSFWLEVPNCDSELSLYMNTWVERLIRCSIKHMWLSNLNVTPSTRYSIPRAILSAKSLTKLYLRGRMEFNGCGNMNLVSLKELVLNNVFLSSELFERLVNSCSTLTDLCLYECDGLFSIKIVGLPGLEKLELDSNKNLEKVEIDEQSLTRLDYTAYGTEQDDIKFANCTSLKILSLFGANLTGEQLSMQLLKLNKLKELYIRFRCKVTSLNISSPHLTRLSLNHCENLTTTNIIAPELRRLFLFGYYNGVASERLLLLSIDAPSKLKVKFNFYTRVLGPTRYIGLLNMLSTFNLKSVILSTNIRNATIPQEWKKYFSRAKSLTELGKSSVGPEVRLLDVLRNSCRVKSYGWEPKILIDDPVELHEDGE